MDGMQQKLEQVQIEVNKVIKGKEDVVKKVLAAVIAGGHILMEDIPGVGKTTLATTFANVCRCIISVCSLRRMYCRVIFWAFPCITLPPRNLNTVKVRFLQTCS